MSETEKAPALTGEQSPRAVFGEVWRGEIRGDLFAVALQGAVTIWRWSLTYWVTPLDPTDRADAVNAWAMAERARADTAESERDYLMRREQSIIEACERVADGGQYRADIVSAVQRIREERDAARSELGTEHARLVEARAEVARLRRLAEAERRLRLTLRDAEICVNSACQCEQSRARAALVAAGGTP